MSFKGTIGDVVETGRCDGGISSLEWKIPDFLSLACEGRDYYRSPEFNACDGRWCFSIHPKGLWQTIDWMSLILCRLDSGPPKTLSIKLGIRGPEGVENKKEIEKEFSTDDWTCYWITFCQRSKLTEQNSRLMPGNNLTLTLDMKSVMPSVAREASTQTDEGCKGAAVSTDENESSEKQDNDLLKKEVEAFGAQIKTLQKTVENYELESQNFKIQISTLESEKLSISEEYKCQLEEKLTIVSGLEKDNDILKKVVESFTEQIKTLQKTFENYELESQNYKEQINTLESEKLSTAEEYKCLLEEKITIVSGLEKGNEQLEKKVESLLEQIKTQEKTVENYELESENYKKQISALESSGLRKAIFFGTLLFIVLEFLAFLLD